jgi:hypothetical protein
MPTPRPLPWIIGAIAAGAILWLVLGQRDVAPPAERAQPAPPPAAAPSAPDPAPHPAAGHHDHDPAQPGADPAAATDELDPETMSMLPEPAGEGDTDERPAREPLTPEEQRQRNERALALIDRSIERLEAERQAAEASGDTRTAERNRVRVERLRQRRAALTQPPPEATP